MQNDFLPITPAEMRERGWKQPDFVYVTGDAYVDHPSFGAAIITRLLESQGFKVAQRAGLSEIRAAQVCFFDHCREY